MRTGTYTHCAFAVAALLLLPARIWPQALGSVSPLDGYTAGQASLGRPAGFYALSGFETLNLASGQVNINIPLLTVKGRGSVAVPITIPLNDQIWDATATRYVYNCNSSSCQIGNGYVVTSSGWISNLGSEAGTMALRSAGDYCVPVPNTNQSQWNTVLTRATFVAPDGTETEFVDQNGGVAKPGNVGYNRGTVFIADNGSFAKFTSSSAISDPTYCGSAVSYPSGTMLLRDGANYTIINGSVTRIRDRNGNLTLFSGPDVTDSVGRTYQFVGGSVSGRTYSKLQYTGAGGAQRAITVWYGALSALLAPGESIKTYGQLWTSIPTSTQASNLNQTYDPNDRVSEIDLPDGSRYLMTYNAYGDVAQITLPTGGVVQYDYNAGGFCASTSPGQVNLMINSTPTPTTEPSVEMCALTRPLKERREVLGGSIVSKTDFPSPGEIDRHDGSGTLLSKETHTITNTGTLPSSGTNYNSWQYNQQSMANYYDAGGSTLLESQTNAWIQGTCKVNCSTIQTVTTTRNGTVKQTAYTYDGYNNVNDQKDYDWGVGSHGALLRETQTSFVTSATYTGINILGLPTETKIFDASGTLFADTKYSYDAQTFIEPNLNGTYHDNVNFNGNQPRGNPTTVQQCLNVASCTWLTTTFGYDIAGNLVWQTDANNHTTFFHYDDDYSNGQNPYTYAFVTSTTNASGQSAYWQYDFGTGQPTIAEDINLQQTIYSYNDPLDRLTQTHSPNGANSYQSYPNPNTIITQQDQNSAGDAALKSQTLYDGFGRVKEADTYETASQYIATTQNYDALGRLATTTNPSRPGDGLNYTTTYSYDGLGRPTKVTTPDGAVAATTYTANWTTVTDAAGHARELSVDGLGQISTVYEDPSGLNYVTLYGHDPLGNLTWVSQGYCGQPNCEQRTFAYDSLSRLQAVWNPESETVTYGYDNVANVLKRTDNRGFVTTYTYDALNRLTGQTYGDGTPSVSYTYDAASVPNSKGHLTSVGNANSTTNYTNFDVAGNVLASSQVTAGQSYPFAYAYNLAGALTKETYPSGRVVTTSYDTANRPSTMSGKLGSASTNYVLGAGYWPHGAPYWIWYGNNVVPGAAYNNRLQPASIWATVNNTPNAYVFMENPGYGTTNNNGNVLGINLYAGGPGTLGTLTAFSQSYGYDGVNRLSSSSDTGGWSRNFGYDTWGNMWVSGNSGVPLAGNTPTSNVFTAYHNKINGASYDGAGNLTSVNGNTAIYDAENRQTKVTEEPAFGGAVETLLYDGTGQRVQKTITGGTNKVYVYDIFGYQMSEYWSGSLAKDYIRLAGKALVVENNVPADCSTCYLSFDHLGSIRMVTDQNGNVISRHDYLPFGEEIPGGYAGRSSQWGVADGAANQRFTGQVRDSETGEDFFNARYFTPALGRFNSPDPMNAGADPTDPQTWNAYGYVRGNPLNATDPSGLCSTNDNPPCYSASATTSAKGDPDFASSADPYQVSDWISFATYSSQRLNSGVGSIFTATGIGVADRNPQTVSTLTSSALTPANTLAMVFPTALFEQKPANPQYCQSLALKIANLKQKLRNKAWDLDRKPNPLPDDAPGQPNSASQWGHVATYIKYQIDLANNERNYGNKCGGGSPPAVQATEPVTAPAHFVIPAWLLFGAGAAAVGAEFAPFVVAF